MNEDFSAKLEQLKDMLNNEQLSDNFNNILSQLSNNNNSEQNTFQSTSSSDENDTLALISKFKSILDKKNRVDDPRINLLNAMKPYLNANRQSKIESCIKIMNLTLIANILKDESL